MGSSTIKISETSKMKAPENSTVFVIASAVLWLVLIGAKILGYAAVPWLMVVTGVIWIPVALFLAILIGPILMIFQ